MPARKKPPARATVSDPSVFRRRLVQAIRGRWRRWGEAKYRFFRDNSAPPEPTDTPFATAASLPATPADTFADGTWYLSVAKFNGIYQSEFLPIGPEGETYLKLEISGGAEVANGPVGPSDVALETQAGGVVRVLAWLDTNQTDADQWAIAYTTNGSTPAEDSPDVTVDLATTGMAILDYQLPAAADGATVKVRVQTRRNDGTDVSPSWVYSDGSEVLEATADATGPTAPLSGGGY